MQIIYTYHADDSQGMSRFIHSYNSTLLPQAHLTQSVYPVADEVQSSCAQSIAIRVLIYIYEHRLIVLTSDA